MDRHALKKISVRGQHNTHYLDNLEINIYLSKIEYKISRNIVYQVRSKQFYSQHF